MTDLYYQVVQAILHERSDDLTKEACDECEQCGKLVMCSYHSVLSELAGHVSVRAEDGTWLRLPNHSASKQTLILNTPQASWNCTLCRGPIDPTEQAVSHPGGFAHKDCANGA
jgi:hypothetical protein